MTPIEAVPLFESTTTWFYEKATFDFPGILTIRMVGGARNGKRSSIEVDGNSIGPYDEVSPLPHSPVVDVRFSDVWIYDIAREGHECAPEGERIRFSDYLQELPEATFDHLLANPLTQTDFEYFGLRRWFLWTEDFVIYVICKGEPDISSADGAPNLQLDRGTTYFA